MMRLSFSAYKQVQSISFPTANTLINMDQFIISRPNRVVVVMGATGTGKTRLSIDLANRFDGEIINSDKIQVYKGLDVVTNKITDEETRGIPHHLLGIVDPNAHFSAQEFVHRATTASKSITGRAKLPIIAGGSNSFIKALVNENAEFRSKFECCFLWVDVSVPVLHSAVSDRVDKMVRAGLVDETREFYEPRGDYSKGIRRAIGVPEMDELFRNEGLVDDETRKKLLEECIDRIKVNTRSLASRQVKNILRLEQELRPCRVHRLNATEMFLTRGKEEADEAWEKLVAGPGTSIVGRFLCEDYKRVGFVPAKSNLGAAATAVTTASYY
ncbi:hypothetical protein CASFOL_005333 [Castilleja foliolosa]|uniref:adenylate dimethylallyltransferase (ADP/ATP-dependent) n=1 Tax=Castilleja foliolosa TaxID=1961234 RepID=A0ABD3E349_9LAMI